MKSFKDLRIIFFGTPSFAVASLDALVRSGASVVAVVTALDKKAGRGLQITTSPVKQYALAAELPLLQPERLKDDGFLTVLKGFEADVQVVVAFRMLPEVVWNMPPMGTINVHASLLPQFRGAAPINHAIINGADVTGVTTFRLLHAIDTGNILMQSRVPILPNDDAGSVHDKLMAEGARILIETLKGLANGSVRESPQVTTDALKDAPRIFKEDTRINWDRPVAAIHNFVRGLAPFPTAFTTLDGKTVKVYASHILEQPTQKPSGNYETDNSTFLRFAGADGWVYIDEVQAEGKKKMTISSFLKGFRSHPK